MSKYGTNFIESEAILAAGVNDMTEVERQLAKLTETELRELANACQLLAKRAREWIQSGGVEL